jgi:hypothetical protein
MLLFPYVRAIVPTAKTQVGEQWTREDDPEMARGADAAQRSISASSVGAPELIASVSALPQTRVARGRLNPGTSSPLNVLPVRKAQ